MFEVATEVSLYYIIFGGIATRDIGRIPRQTLVHPDFGKNNGKIGLFGGFSVFKNRPILPLVSRKIENNGKIGLFWFSILPLFSENNGKNH